MGRSVSELSSCISLGEHTVSLLLARLLKAPPTASRLLGELVAREAARRPGVRVEVRAGVTAELIRLDGVLAELRVGVLVDEVTLDAIISAIFSIWRSTCSDIMLLNFSPMLPIMLPSLSVMIDPIDSIIVVTSASLKVFGTSTVSSGGSITLMPRVETSRTRCSDRF